MKTISSDGSIRFIRTRNCSRSRRRIRFRTTAFPTARAQGWRVEQGAAVLRTSGRERARYREVHVDHFARWTLYTPRGETWKGFEAVRGLQGLSDEVLLLRLLSNLLANGLRAAPPGAIVRLSAGPSAARPGWLWLEVANPCSTTDGAAGTRLGLRICREIAALHGGQLDILMDTAAATVTVRTELPEAAGQPAPP